MLTTDEEMANRSSQAYKDRVAAEEAERLRKWDESLLLRYSSIAYLDTVSRRNVAIKGCRHRNLGGTSSTDNSGTGTHQRHDLQLIPDT